MARTQHQSFASMPPAQPQVDESTKMTYVFDHRGKRTQATVENARGMVSGTGFSALWPRGTPAEEAYEMEKLATDSSETDAIVRAQQPRRSSDKPQITSLDQDQFKQSSFSAGTATSGTQEELS